ncbi:class II myosin [Mucor velutinosus]|uniref:Class II myosin n=1 Tax=Mucor velutinosus TaxID=708070 RepID=A0AAN7D5Y5_9FUNG|nr:class II myosin [Mucor velutinosus]
MSAATLHQKYGPSFSNKCSERSTSTASIGEAATTAALADYCTPLKDNTKVLAEDSDLKLLNEINSFSTSNGNNSNYDLSYYFGQSMSTSTTKTTTNLSDNFPNVIYKRGRSLSIDSIISVNHQQQQQQQAMPLTQPFVILSDENKTQIYKKKTDKSNKKAFQFFGEQVKLEISAKEIRREGPRALLHSTVPLAYFLYHLLNKYSSENLFFYLAVDNYEHFNFSSYSERYQVANKIYKTYLTRNSDVEVNLEDRIYRQVTNALSSQYTTTGKEFEAAKRHVFSLLNVSYQQFRTSSVWDIMESKCSDLKSYNRSRSQALVVNLLLSQIKWRNRDSATFKLVHSFCRIYLPFGYDHRLLEEPTSTPTSSSSITNRRSRSKSTSNSSESKKNGGFITSKFDIFKLSRK